MPINYHLVSVEGCGTTFDRASYITNPVYANCSVTTTFAIDQYLDTVSLDGDSIQYNNPSVPGDIACNLGNMNYCDETYAQTTAVALTASPADGFTFFWMERRL